MEKKAEFVKFIRFVRFIKDFECETLSACPVQMGIRKVECVECIGCGVYREGTNNGENVSPLLRGLRG